MTNKKKIKAEKFNRLLRRNEKAQRVAEEINRRRSKLDEYNRIYGTLQKVSSLADTLK